MQHVRILDLYTNGVYVIDIGTCYISTSQGREGGTFELRGDRSMPPMVLYPIPYYTTHFIYNKQVVSLHVQGKKQLNN